MPSLRIPLSDKNAPRIIQLTGARITVGRHPDNTVQILDRTLSGRHAEFILDEGVYRLHDVGSTNGTFVDDQKIEDYHLRQPCRVNFGTVECAFTLEDAPAGVEETLPNQAEVKAVREENQALKTRVASLSEQVEKLKNTPAPVAEGGTALQKEMEKMAGEHAALKEAEQRLKQEVARLENDLAILRRERENVQSAWDASKAELEGIRKQLTAEVEHPTALIAARKAFPNAEPPAGTPAKVPVPMVRPAPQPATTQVRPFPRAQPAAPSSPGLSPRPVIRPDPAAPAAPTASPSTPGIKPRLPVAPRLPNRPGPRGTQRLGS